MFALEKKLVRSPTEVICLACSFISYIGQIYTRADQATALFHIIRLRCRAAACSVGWFVKKYCWLVCVRENTVPTENLRSFTTSHSQTNRLQDYAYYYLYFLNNV